MLLCILAWRNPPTLKYMIKPIPLQMIQNKWRFCKRKDWAEIFLHDSSWLGWKSSWLACPCSTPNCFRKCTATITHSPKNQQTGYKSAIIITWTWQYILFITIACLLWNTVNKYKMVKLFPNLSQATSVTNISKDYGQST